MAQHTSEYYTAPGIGLHFCPCSHPFMWRGKEELLREALLRIPWHLFEVCRNVHGVNNVYANLSVCFFYCEQPFTPISSEHCPFYWWICSRCAWSFSDGSCHKKAVHTCYEFALKSCWYFANRFLFLIIQHPDRASLGQEPENRTGSVERLNLPQPLWRWADVETLASRANAADFSTNAKKASEKVDRTLN